MAEEALFEKATPTTMSWEVRGVEYLLYMDAIVTEGHTINATVTQHPVEFGANISDHIILEPREYKMKARISSFPLTRREDSLSGSLSRPRAAWKMIEDLMFSRSFVILRNDLASYSNLVLKTISTERDSQTSNVLDFDATFTEVFVVDTPAGYIDGLSVVNNPTSVAINASVSDQASKELNIGFQNVETPSSTVESRIDQYTRTA